MIRPSDSVRSPRVSHRRGKGEKANKKQMAYVGATTPLKLAFGRDFDGFSGE
jgi:hypothetical protein